MFHEALTVAAHLSLLAKLMHEISGLIRETRIESLSQAPDRGPPSRATAASPKRCASRIHRRLRAMADHIRLVSDVALLREAD